MHTRQPQHASASVLAFLFGPHAVQWTRRPCLNRASRGLNSQFVVGASRRLNSQGLAGASRRLNSQSVAAAPRAAPDNFSSPAHGLLQAQLQRASNSFASLSTPTIRSRPCSASVRALFKGHQRQPHSVPPARPNPSFKRSANGRPPSPGRRYAVHFRQPGLGVLPSSPA